MARKSKYTPKAVDDITTAIQIGATYALAAAYAGIGERTFYDWLAQYPQFSQAVKLAEGKAAIGWLARIEKAANDGTWQAAAWKLERRYPHAYGRTVQEHTGKDGGDIVIRAIRIVDPDEADPAPE
jgi:hypothetical protein